MGRSGGRPGTFCSASPARCCRCSSAPRSAIWCGGSRSTRRASFSLPLFTNFSAKPPVGILDWYTIVAGLFAVVALAAARRHVPGVEDRRRGVRPQPPRRRQPLRRGRLPLAGGDRVTWLVNPDHVSRNSRASRWPGFVIAVAFGGLACVACGLRRRAPCWRSWDRARISSGCSRPPPPARSRSCCERSVTPAAR